MRKPRVSKAALWAKENLKTSFCEGWQGQKQLIQADEWVCWENKDLGKKGEEINEFISFWGFVDTSYEEGEEELIC